MPAEGNLLVCCSQPIGDVVTDLWNLTGISIFRAARGQRRPARQTWLRSRLVSVRWSSSG